MVWDHKEGYITREAINASRLHLRRGNAPQCFRGIEGINAAESQRLFAELEDKGYVDEAGYLVENPRFSAWEADVAGDHSPAVRHDLRDLLWAAYAEHEFFGECTVPMLRFFAAQR